MIASRGVKESHLVMLHEVFNYTPMDGTLCWVAVKAGLRRMTSTSSVPILMESVWVPHVGWPRFAYGFLNEHRCLTIFDLFSLVEKVSLMNSSFPSKEICLRMASHTSCPFTDGLYTKIQVRGRGGGVSSFGIEGDAQNSTALCCQLHTPLRFPLLLEGVVHLEEAALCENSVAFKWAKRAREKYLIATHPHLSTKPKISFPLSPITVF